MGIPGIIHKFTVDIPSRPIPKTHKSDTNHHVMLTGTTGMLGSYILSSLLEDNSISRVFCLNRSEDGKSRQIESFKAKGLPLHLLMGSKLEFLKVDLSKQGFGLEHAEYESIMGQVDTIIHNAWEVNWLAPLDSFQNDHIRGVRNIIDFVLHSPQHPHIFFLSSVATFYRWSDRYSTPVPESLVDDCEIPLEVGYAESKYVTDWVLKTASEQCGLDCTILRMGQIAGPTMVDGMWNPGDVMPSIIATSISLGQLPIVEGEGGRVDWIPSDMAGTIVAEVVRHRQQEQNPQLFAVFNIVNPNPVSWLEVASAIQEMYPVELVSMQSWLNALKQTAHPTRDLQRFPALKLMGRLQIWLGDGQVKQMQIETSLVRAASTTLESLPPVSRELMLNWLRQWGFFPELILYG